MSLKNTYTIDRMGQGENTGIVYLYLDDNYPWGKEAEHLKLLEDKINAYLTFIQSNQGKDSFDFVAGYAIDITFKFPPTKNAIALMEETKRIAEQLNVMVNYRHSPHAYKNR